MRYFPAVTMTVVATSFTVYLLNLEDNPFYQFDLVSMLFIMSPLVLVGGLIWILKFPDAFARSVVKVISFFQTKNSKN